MFSASIDQERAIAVWLMSGASNTEEDYARYVESLLHVQRFMARRERGFGMMVVDADNPPPNAIWRKRIADASTQFPAGCYYVLVSESVIIRGVMTALNWIRPLAITMTTKATVEEGIAWLATHGDASTAAALRLAYHRARADARTTSR